MKYYIIAGEASGDLIASKLMQQIRLKDAQAAFRVWGGDLMQNAGGVLVKHYKDLAFMGFLEVFLNLRTILRNLSFCKKDLLNHLPDVLILVDYPGFNLRIAEFAKRHGIKVVYYISPQIWAWKKNRIKGIKKNVDKMLVILPFESAFYAQHNYSVDFVGHPLLDIIKETASELNIQTFKNDNGLDKRPVIAFLPGSRKQEIKTMLPLMLHVCKAFPEFQCVVSGVSWQPESLYQNIIGTNPVKIVYGQTYNLLLNSTAALVTSGTATLETALLGIPEVVCYKGSRISYEIAKRLIKNIKYISLVNLVADQEVVKELIQIDCTPQKMTTELQKILPEGERRALILKDCEKLKTQLGDEGASERAAEIVVTTANRK